MNGCFVFTVLCLLLLQFSESVVSSCVGEGENLGRKCNKTELNGLEKQENIHLDSDNKKANSATSVEIDPPVKNPEKDIKSGEEEEKEKRQQNKANELFKDTQSPESVGNLENTKSNTQLSGENSTQNFIEQITNTKEPAEIADQKTETIITTVKPQVGDYDSNAQDHAVDATAQTEKTTEKIEETETTSIRNEMTVGQKVEDQTTAAKMPAEVAGRKHENQTTTLKPQNQSSGSNSIAFHGTSGKYFNIIVATIFINFFANNL